MLTNAICIFLVILCGIGMKWVQIREQNRRDAMRKAEREEDRQERQAARAHRAPSASAHQPAAQNATLRNRLITNGTIRPGNSNKVA